MKINPERGLFELVEYCNSNATIAQKHEHISDFLDIYKDFCNEYHGMNNLLSSALLCHVHADIKRIASQAKAMHTPEASTKHNPLIPLSTAAETISYYMRNEMVLGIDGLSPKLIKRIQAATLMLDALEDEIREENEAYRIEHDYD